MDMPLKCRPPPMLDAHMNYVIVVDFVVALLITVQLTMWPMPSLPVVRHLCKQRWCCTCTPPR